MIPRLRFIDVEDEGASARSDDAGAGEEDEREEKTKAVDAREGEGASAGASAARKAAGRTEGETKMVMVVVPEYAPDAMEPDRKRLRSIRRRLVQTPEHREKERLRSQRRRDALTPEQKRAAADAKIARRKRQRMAKQAADAAKLLAGQLEQYDTQ